MQEGRVRFRYNDYADGHEMKVMNLSTEKFMCRFLMHTLPKAFVRIRYYGFLANRCREQLLNRCRRLLGVPLPADQPSDQELQQYEDSDASTLFDTCPVCKQGNLVVIHIFIPDHQLRPRRPHFLARSNTAQTDFDSS